MRGLARLAVFLAVGFVIVLSLHGIWTARAAGRLRSAMDACRARGEPILPEDFESITLDPNLNSVPLLRAAADQTDTKRPSWRAYLPDFEDARLPFTPDEIRLIDDFTKAWEPAIPLVAEASHRPRSLWQWKLPRPVVLDAFADLAPQRRLSHLLIASALLAHHRGDDATATDRAALLTFQARAMAQYPGTIGLIVATGISEGSASTVSQIAPDLQVGSAHLPQGADRNKVQALIHQLLDDEPFAEGAANALLFERMCGADAILAFFNAIKNETQFMEVRLGGGPVMAALMRPLAYDDATLAVHHIGGESSAVRSAQTYNAYVRTAPAFPQEINAHPLRHSFARIGLRPNLRVIQGRFCALADRRMAATALALRLYYLDHGGPAMSLDELVPDYLPALPADPFNEGKPIQYKSDRSAPILYSIGVNGIDDGGSDEPLTKAQSSRSASNRPPWERKDVVVHLTRPPRNLPETVPASMPDGE